MTNKENFYAYVQQKMTNKENLYAYVQQKMTNKENLYQMVEGNPKKPRSPNKQLSDSDTSDEEPINPILKTSVKERHYGTDNTQLSISHTSSP